MRAAARLAAVAAALPRPGAAAGACTGETRADACTTCGDAACTTLSKTPAASADTCCALCSGNAQCTAWTWSSKQALCRAKAGPWRLAKAGQCVGSTSGAPPPHPVPPTPAPPPPPSTPAPETPVPTPVPPPGPPNNRRPGLLPPPGTAWRGSTVGNVGTYTNYTHTYGARLQLLRRFTMPNGGNADLTASERAFVAGGGILWYNINFNDWGEAANGTMDSVIERYAAAVASAAPARLFVCVLHEPDHKISTSAEKTAENYHGLWRRVQQVFAAQGTTNAVWVLDYSKSIWPNPMNRGPAADTSATVVPLWPGDGVIDWVFFNVFEKAPPKKYGGLGDYVDGIYRFLEATSAAGHNFTACSWGLGAMGTHDDVDPAGRAQFFADARAMAGDRRWARLRAFVYFDGQNSAVVPSLLPAYRDYLSADAFVANDPGAPPGLPLGA